jgi:metallophosphoesterase (TIGR00282 family)
MPVSFKVLLLGDVYGAPGCRALFFGLPKLRKQYEPDIVAVNGENACDGFGLDSAMMFKFFEAGVDVITSGNHIWQQDDLIPYLDSEPRLLRPANYPSGNPGKGIAFSNGCAVINLQGRYSMQPVDCPFRTGLAIAEKARKQTPLLFVDFHAENTAEKEALGFYLDGKVTAVVGTHTHVQTADEKILPNGTAYITDIGMCGPAESVIGSDPQSSILKQMTQMPYKPVVCENPASIQGVLIEADRESGKALSITRIDFPCGV